MDKLIELSKELKSKLIDSGESNLSISSFIELYEFWEEKAGLRNEDGDWIGITNTNRGLFLEGIRELASHSHDGSFVDALHICRFGRSSRQSSSLVCYTDRERVLSHLLFSPSSPLQESGVGKGLLS